MHLQEDVGGDNMTSAVASAPAVDDKTRSTHYARNTSIRSAELKGSLPRAHLDESVDAGAIAKQCVEYLGGLELDHLLSDALWKDNICITGTFRTIYSSKAIHTAWTEAALPRKPSGFQVVPSTAKVFKLGPVPAWITTVFTFQLTESPACQCSGSLNAVPDEDGKWKIFSLATILEQIDHFPNPDAAPPVPPKPLGDGPLDCLVVGAGGCGISLGAHLQGLGLKYLIAEKNDHVGDNWALRYDSAKLHLSASFSELPFGRYMDYSRYFPTKADLAAAFQAFVKRWQINVQTSSTVEKASWDGDRKTWSVRMSTSGGSDTVETKHLVMAIGGGLDKAVIPELKDREKYQGSVLHMTQWKNAKPFAGQRGVVVGAANSAFDIIEDMVLGGMSSVTMIQRGATKLSPVEYTSALIDAMYSQHSDIGVADRMFITGPYQHGRLMTMGLASQFQAQEPNRYDKLRDAGFNFIITPDIMSGPIDSVGSHHLDVGQTKYISDGRVKVKSGSAPAAFTEKGLRLENGDEVEADLICFATGFRFNLKQSTTEIVGKEIGDRLDEFFRLDSEGEIRGLAKPIGHPNIWYLGGGTHLQRFIPRFLAMQILAEVQGMPFKPYMRRFQ